MLGKKKHSKRDSFFLWLIESAPRWECGGGGIFFPVRIDKLRKETKKKKIETVGFALFLSFF